MAIILREITGTVRKPNGDVWANAQIVFELISSIVADADAEAVYPRRKQAIDCDENGLIPTSGNVPTVIAGYTYKLHLPDGAYGNFVAPTDSAAALSIDEVIALIAGGAAEETEGYTGIPLAQADLLLDLYDAAQDADAGEVAEADGAGKVVFNGRVGLPTADAAWVAAGRATVPDASTLETTTGAQAKADAAQAAAIAELDPRLDILEAALIPVAVDDLSATANGSTAINLTWTYTAVAAISGFKIYRKTGIGGTYTLVDTAVSTDTTFSDTGLDYSTTYYYILYAYNTFFQTAGNETYATTDNLIPSDVANLSLWLDANAITGLSDGDSVTNWLDTSGNNNNSTQSSAAAKPTYKTNIIGGKPVVRFDGGDHLLISDHTTLDLSAPFWIVAVASSTSLSVGGQSIIYKDNAYNFGRYGTNFFFASVGIANFIPSTSVYPTATPLIYTIYFDASYDANFYVNGGIAEIVAGAANISANSNNVYVGSNSAPGAYWAGDIAEILIYSVPPSAAEQEGIYSYLSTKWDIPLARTTTGVSATNAVSPLTTPTYDGSGEVVHPDVYDAGDGNAFQGYRYWMAVTPYPLSDNTKENPSILASTDGATWSVPSGLTNPITPYPGGGAHLADTDILLGQDNKLYCFYIWNDGGTNTKVYVKSSTDGIVWSSATEILSSATKSLISPAVIWDGTQYVMWCIDQSGSPETLTKRTSATPDGSWSAPETCVLTGRSGNLTSILGHIDVRLYQGTYYAVLSSTSLYVATSGDGKYWVAPKSPFMIKSVSGWDNSLLYRATFVPLSPDTFDVWYSAKSTSNNWRVGRTNIIWP